MYVSVCVIIHSNYVCLCMHVRSPSIYVHMYNERQCIRSTCTYEYMQSYLSLSFACVCLCFASIMPAYPITSSFYGLLSCFLSFPDAKYTPGLSSSASLFSLKSLHVRRLAPPSLCSVSLCRRCLLASCCPNTSIATSPFVSFFGCCCVPQVLYFISPFTPLFFLHLSQTSITIS